jgi:hypothetical protein
MFDLLWMEDKMSAIENKENRWRGVYMLGAAAALGAVLVGVIEILITFLPGGNTTQETVLDWFMLYQANPFMGLRNLGLLNILINTLGILTFFALYAAHRKSEYQPYAALAVIVSYLGVGVFYATNRAFPMLELSHQYAVATTEMQRAVVEAAGQSMLSVGASHTPGTFLGFALSEAAGMLVSIVMLRSRIFSAATAYTGMLGFGILFIFEFLASFISGLGAVTMSLAMLGGLLSMAWYILVAFRLFQLGRESS